MIRPLASLLLLAPLAVWAQPRPAGDEAVRYGQTIADLIRTSASADAAFLPQGMLKDALAGRDLAGALAFPAEEVAVVKLTGAQVRQALERSVSIFPTPSPGWLHVSGLDVVFNPSAPSDKRIVSASLSGQALDNSRTYRVAMPGSLARGGLGYFTVWSKGALESRTGAPTLEAVVKGQQPIASPSRWSAAKGSSGE